LIVGYVLPVGKRFQALARAWHGERIAVQPLGKFIESRVVSRRVAGEAAGAIRFFPENARAL
jgi:hypothetical protein